MVAGLPKGKTNIETLHYQFTIRTSIQFLSFYPRKSQFPIYQISWQLLEASTRGKGGKRCPAHFGWFDLL
jgi:hypothetical protein